MARWRVVVITDSANKELRIHLTMNGVGKRGGTWEGCLPGRLLYSKGTFQSYSVGLWGDQVRLTARDPNVGAEVVVLVLYDFWFLDELWANDSGKARIYQGSTMKNDNQARWEVLDTYPL